MKFGKTRTGGSSNSETESYSLWIGDSQTSLHNCLDEGVYLAIESETLSELVTDPDDKAVVAFVASLGALGRGLAMPPGVPSEAVEVLRKGYDAMNADPAFEQELKKRKLRLIPATGAQIEKIVADSIKGATPAVVEKARKLIFGS